MQSVENLIRTEGTSVFSDKDAVLKFTFDLCVTLELYLAGHKETSMKFFSDQNKLTGSKLEIDDQCQVIADSILTYCVVNKHDDLASFILRNVVILGWYQSATYPDAISERDQFAHKNWYLFCNQFRRPTKVYRADVTKGEPFRFQNKTRNIKQITPSITRN